MTTTIPEKLDALFRELVMRPHVEDTSLSPPGTVYVPAQWVIYYFPYGLARNDDDLERFLKACAQRMRADRCLYPRMKTEYIPDNRCWVITVSCDAPEGTPRWIQKTSSPHDSKRVPSLVAGNHLWRVTTNLGHRPDASVGIIQDYLGNNEWIVHNRGRPNEESETIKSVESFDAQSHRRSQKHKHKPQRNRAGHRGSLVRRVTAGNCARGSDDPTHRRMRGSLWLAPNNVTDVEEDPCVLWRADIPDRVDAITAQQFDDLVIAEAFFDSLKWNGTGEVGCVMDTGIDEKHCGYYSASQSPDRFTFTGSTMNPSLTPGNTHKIKAYFATASGIEYTRDFDGGHGTAVACLGFCQPCTTVEGSGTGARLVFFDAAGDLSDQTSLAIPDNVYAVFGTARNLGATFSVSSWGASSGEYDSISYQFDEFASDNDEFLHCVSAGNSGGPTTLSSPANAKNVVSVGATMISPEAYQWVGGYVNLNSNPELFREDCVADFSSYGTTADGRFGPLIAAPGVYVSTARASRTGTTLHYDTKLSSGTSPAVETLPIASLQQYLHFGLGRTHASSALKRALLASNTAPAKRVVNGLDALVTEVTPFDPRAAGFGVLRFKTGFWNASDFANKWAVVDRGADAYTRCYLVTNGSDFVATLSWTDPPPSMLSDTVLVNDLDLRVSTASQVMWGNMGNVTDTLNNNEMVRFTWSGSANTTVKVSVTDPFASAQLYALVVYVSTGIVNATCNSSCSACDAPAECDISNGNGYNLCKADGTVSSACTPYSCVSPRVFNLNGTCVAANSTNATTIRTCAEGFAFVNGACASFTAQCVATVGSIFFAPPLLSSASPPDSKLSTWVKITTVCLSVSTLLAL